MRIYRKASRHGYRFAHQCLDFFEALETIKGVRVKARADVLVYVVGGEDENELILDTVLDGVTGALSILLGGDVSANNILEHLDVVMLSVDETVDDGIILEVDSKTIVNRVLMQGADGSAKDITDMTISQAMEVAREQLLKNVV